MEERRASGIRPEQRELEEGLNSEGLTLDYGRMAEESTYLNESGTIALTITKPESDAQDRR